MMLPLPALWCCRLLWKTPLADARLRPPLREEAPPTKHLSKAGEQAGSQHVRSRECPGAPWKSLSPQTPL